MMQFAVLDEADEMLNMGFKEAVETILDATTPEIRQTVLFSATHPPWATDCASIRIPAFHADVSTLNTTFTHARCNRWIASKAIDTVQSTHLA